MPMEPLPLRDIQLPDPIGWWPLAPGWWGLLALLISLIVILVYVIRRRRRVTPIKLALAELTRLEANPDLSARAQLETLSILMRRVAMTLCPREDVAGRVGEDWLNWLNNATGTAHFEGEQGKLLISGTYSEDPSASLVAELLTTYRQWLVDMGKTHGR